MPFDQLFQFAHLCLDDPGIQSLKDDIVDSMELSKLWRDFLELDGQAPGPTDEDRQARRDKQLAIIAKARVITEAFFTDVDYKFTAEELAALKPGIRNPVQAPPSRAIRRQLNRLNPHPTDVSKLMGPDGRPL